MPRIRMTQRRTMLYAARDRAKVRVVTAIRPVLNSQFKQLERFLRRSTLRKRLKRIKAPAEITDPLKVSLFKVQTLLSKQAEGNLEPPKPDKEKDDKWKAALLLALLLGLYGGVDDIGAAENEVWESRGFDPLTFDPEQVVQDYQNRIGRNLSDLGGDTLDRSQEIIAAWYMTDKPFSELMDKLESLFDEARAEAIAATEINNVTSQIVFQEMLSRGWSEWYWDALGENPCTQPLTIKGMVYDGCLDLNGRLFKIGDPMPPDAAHTNCECLPTPRVV